MDVRCRANPGKRMGQNKDWYNCWYQNNIRKMLFFVEGIQTSKVELLFFDLFDYVQTLKVN